MIGWERSRLIPFKQSFASVCNNTAFLITVAHTSCCPLWAIISPNCWVNCCISGAGCSIHSCTEPSSLCLRTLIGWGDGAAATTAQDIRCCKDCKMLARSSGKYWSCLLKTNISLCGAAFTCCRV